MGTLSDESDRNHLLERLNQLYSRTAHGIKFGLDVETVLLERLQNPHHQMLHIHVAGTNGKGSVCAMLESVLREGGVRTGLYTSPHLISFNERIRVNGEPIPDLELLELIDLVNAADCSAQHVTGREATFFEFTTAIAFEYFRRRQVQVAVLETGMGGRLDATNVVIPLLSIITRIGLEHTQYLGKSLREIAGEKCGIIKQGRPVVCIHQADDVCDIIEERASEKNAPVIWADECVSIQPVRESLTGQTIRIETASENYGTIKLPFSGRYQLENLSLAIAALEWLSHSIQTEYETSTIKDGLQEIELPGRCQMVSEDPPVILDVAHNPDGAVVLVESLRKLAKKRPICLIAGLLDDKDAEGFFSAFAPLVSSCSLVEIQQQRALSLADMERSAWSAGIKSLDSGPLKTMLQNACRWAEREKGLVCIAGSLYLAGEVLSLMNNEDIFGNG